MDTGCPAFSTLSYFIVTKVKDACYGVLSAGLAIVSVFILGNQVFLTSGQNSSCLLFEISVEM